MTGARVALLGAHGHGEVHLRNIARLSAAGAAQLVGVADPREPTEAHRALTGPSVPWLADAAELLHTVRPDVTVVCTPIPLHLAHAEAAMEVRSHLLLEKPPAPTLADFRRLTEAVSRNRRVCQVGFQALGSRALAELRAGVVAGRLGRVESIGVLGEWLRDDRYYQRARWSGRRTVDGAPTLDGAVSNPFAHGLSAALAVDGSEDEHDIVSVEAELYHANPIETDDTSSVRIQTRRGTVITVAVTLCAPQPREPRLVVRGTHGTAELRYTEDRLTWHGAGGETQAPAERTDLLENLVDHLRDPSVTLVSPLSRSAAFMAVVERVRRTEPVRAVPEAWVRRVRVGESEALTIPDVHQALAECVQSSRLLSQTSVQWAPSAGRKELQG